MSIVTDEMVKDALGAFLDDWSPCEPTDYLRSMRKALEAVAPMMVDVAEDEDGLPAGYADFYNQRFMGQTLDTKRDHDCEAAWRAALAYAVGRAK